MGDHNLKQKMLSGALWQSLERFGLQGFSFVLQLVLARLLLPDDFGIVVLLDIFIQLAWCFVDSGFGVSMIQCREAEEKDFSGIYWISQGIAFLLYAMLFLAAPFIAGFYQLQQLAGMLRIAALSLFFIGHTSVCTAIINRKLRFRKLFFIGFPATVLGGVLGVVLALLGLGAWSLVWMQLVTSILRFVFAFAQVPWIPQFQFNKPLTIQMFRFGCNLLLINIIGVICDNLPSFVIGKLFSPSQLGYYSKSRKIPFFFVNGVKWSVGGTIFPALSAQQNDRIVQRKIVCNGIIFSSFLLMPLLAFLAGAGNNIILILLGHNWMPTVPYMQIAIAGFLFWPLHAVNREVLIANGCGKFLLRLELLNKLFFITCFAIGILGGVSGILWGMALSSLLTFVIYSQGSRRILNYGALQQVKDVARIVGCASLAGIVVWLEERLMVNCVFLLLIQVGTGIVLYLAASLLINREQSIAAWRILERVRNGLRTRSLFA